MAHCNTALKCDGGFYTNWMQISEIQHIQAYANKKACFSSNVSWYYDSTLSLIKFSLSCTFEIHRQKKRGAEEKPKALTKS